VECLRNQHGADGASGGSPGDIDAQSFRPGGRLNLLLSTAPWRTDPWSEALPRVLEPMGVRSLRAGSAREAERVIRTMPVHIAVVDLRLPLDEREPQQEAGARVLELLSRLSQQPPTVVLKSPSRVREEARHLSSALRCNAFAVVDRTAADLELMLSVMQRVLARHYQGRWPGA
jgi:hypothetical protein